MPFVGTMILMAAGAIGAFFMHPERPFETMAEPLASLRPVLEPAPHG